MTSDFLEQIGVMALVFGLAIVPGLFSRRMERGDYLTLMVIPIAAIPVVVLPGVLTWGFDKNSATYLLGTLIVVAVATLNYRFQPRERTADQVERAPGGSPAAARMATKEG